MKASYILAAINNEVFHFKTAYVIILIIQMMCCMFYFYCFVYLYMQTLLVGQTLKYVLIKILHQKHF